MEKKKKKKRKTKTRKSSNKTKEVKDPYSESFKSSNKEIEETLEDRKTSSTHRLAE